MQRTEHITKYYLMLKIFQDKTIALLNLKHPSLIIQFVAKYTLLQCKGF